MENGNGAALISVDTGEVSAPSVFMSPKQAIQRAREAKQSRDEFIREILVEEVDYGYPPGTEPKTDEERAHRKPSLFKSGAEKITDGYNCYPEYQPINCIEDWENRLWVYHYRCNLIVRGSSVIVASGIGSCNSRESKYAFRDSKRLCPVCNASAIIAGKKEYGGGWLCFAKKGGCGAKFKPDDPLITSQTVGRSENEDIADLVNTIDKMAQKRAFVAANLCLGFSAVFTQDIEDNPSAYGLEAKGVTVVRDDGTTEVRDAGAPAPLHSPFPQNDIQPKTKHDKRIEVIHNCTDFASLEEKEKQVKAAAKLPMKEARELLEAIAARRVVLSYVPPDPGGNEAAKALDIALKGEAGTVPEEPKQPTVSFDSLIESFGQADNMQVWRDLYDAWLWDRELRSDKANGELSRAAAKAKNRLDKAAA